MDFKRKIVRKILRYGRGFSTGLARKELDALEIASGLGGSAWLLHGLVRSLKPEVVVEIGSAQGKSACYIGMALKEIGEGKLYAIDPHTRTDWNDQGPEDTLQIMTENIKKLNLQKHVEIVRQTSVEVRAWWKLTIDMLFIDGDHSYEGVKGDWEMFSPFVRPFGVVIFHDTIWDLKPDMQYHRADMGVPKFVDGLRAEGYPVITLERDFGVSLVQPVLQGVSLRSRRR